MDIGIHRIRAAVVGFVDHDDLTLAASLAYYTALSLAPLVILALWTAGALSWNAQDALVSEVRRVAGDAVARTVGTVIDSAQLHPALGSVAGWLGVIVLVMGAAAVFAQLQLALNIIFGVQSPAHAPSTYWVVRWLRRRLLSVGILASATFVLIVSLVVSAFLAMILPSDERIVAAVVNNGATLIALAALFSALFRYLPDTHLSWRDTSTGALLTAILFAIGKAAIARYVTRTSAGSAYGPAGSFVVLLVWVYYSAAIFLFGAEWIQAGRIATERSTPAIARSAPPAAP